jgi:uncharacterized protein YkwD
VIALRIFVLAAFSAALIAPYAVAEAADAKPAVAMTERINAVRAQHRLPALRVAPKLMRSARAYARRLAQTGSLYHGSAYRVPGFRKSGEMLASDLGSRIRLSGPIRMWLHSPGHRALMLSGGFRYVGAFPARRRGETVWVVHLGAR